ncbi:hypothetical protein ZWY2020_040637, partial [Hordeum vulgare]
NTSFLRSWLRRWFGNSPSIIIIVEFINGLEGRASQMTAVQILMDPKDLVQPEGIDEFLINCKLGNATRSKLRRVMSKNWKERIKNDSADFLSISELLPQSKPFLMGSLRPELKGHLSVMDKHSLNGHNDIVRDFITIGCKLCGLPLYQKNLHGDSTYPIDCRDNPKYLHVIGQIYKPFMIYVQDQTGQVPVLVKNKVAEILFSNINADDVSECYKSRHCMLVDTCDSGQSSTCGMLDGSGKTGIAKSKRTKHKLDFHLILLIVMKCMLNQGKNSPFCFQISVNPGRNVEDG